MTQPTAAVQSSSSNIVTDERNRSFTQRLISQLPHVSIPEMIAPRRTVRISPPVGYVRPLEMREDAPYFNASSYCNRLDIRFSLWLRHPATIALIQSFANYYREAAHEQSPALVMVVKSGSRVVHGYYVHTMLHDALSAWCDQECLPHAERRRLPTTASTMFVYTTQTVINSGSSPEVIAAAQEQTQARIANVISAVRGGTH